MDESSRTQPGEGQTVAKRSGIRSFLASGGSNIAGLTRTGFSAATGESLDVVVDKALDKLRKDPQRQNVGGIGGAGKSLGEQSGVGLAFAPESDVPLATRDDLNGLPVRFPVSVDSETVIPASPRSPIESGESSGEHGEEAVDPAALDETIEFTAPNDPDSSDIKDASAAPEGSDKRDPLPDADGGHDEPPQPPIDTDTLHSEPDHNPTPSRSPVTSMGGSAENDPAFSTKEALEYLINVTPDVITWKAGQLNAQSAMSEKDMQRVDTTWDKFVATHGYEHVVVYAQEYPELRGYLGRRYKRQQEAMDRLNQQSSHNEAPVMSQAVRQSAMSVEEDQRVSEVPSGFVPTVEAHVSNSEETKIDENKFGKDNEGSTRADDSLDSSSQVQNADKKAGATGSLGENPALVAEQEDIDRLPEGEMKAARQKMLNEHAQIQDNLKRSLDAMQSQATVNPEQGNVVSPVVGEQANVQEKPIVSPEPDAIRLDQKGKPVIDQMKKKISESQKSEQKFLLTTDDLVSYATSLRFKNNGELRNIVVTINPQGQLRVEADITGSKFKIRRNGHFFALVGNAQAGGVKVLDSNVGGDKEIVEAAGSQFKQFDKLLVEKMNEQLQGAGSVSISGIDERGVRFISRKIAR